jgi:NAD(P)-dependent dehydrogenase (short-subunit alcohol dehydrogenase family)
VLSSPSSKGAVVVTGASTGIGRACALRLNASGYQVFAGVRKEADAQSLRQATQRSVTPVFLDVCDESQIAAAARMVDEATGGRGLAGLVNNAGVGLTGPTELLPIDLIRRQFEINVFGQMAVTQAFLPQLRVASGRLINIGSIGDRLVMPFGGPINGSKWAFAAFTHALRIELRPWGIHVVLIEPASIRTEAPAKLIAESETTIAGFTDGGRQLYADAHRAMVANFTKHPRKYGTSPDVVARTVLRALTAARPKSRYLVGKSAYPLAAIARFAPDSVFDQIRLRVFHLPDKRFGARQHETSSVIGLRETIVERA